MELLATGGGGHPPAADTGEPGGRSAPGGRAELLAAWGEVNGILGARAGRRRGDPPARVAGERVGRPTLGGSPGNVVGVWLAWMERLAISGSVTRVVERRWMGCVAGRRCAIRRPTI